MSETTRPRRSKRATITDVAKRAGVSIAAVSRILNNSYEGFSAREETKQRVYDAVRELDYRPSRSAVRLATGRHMAIALCYPAYGGEDKAVDVGSLTSIFRQFDHMLVIHGVGRATAARGRDLVLSPRGHGRALRDLLSGLRESVDGVIYVQPEETGTAMADLAASELPFTVVGPPPPGSEGVCGVRVDEVTAGRMAMGHLIVRGCRRILVAVPDRQAQEAAVAARLEGARAAARMFNDPTLGIDVLRLPAEDAPAKSALLNHLARWGRPDGILTLGGHLPFVVLRTLEGERLDVPEDVRLVAFDENPTFQLNSPQISGIRYPIEEMCHRAAELLFTRIETGTAPDPVVVHPTMIARESSR